MPIFMVCGPEYGVKIDIGLDDGTGPMEYGADVVKIEAETKRDALVLGVKMLRQVRRGYLERYDDECPFTGVQVIPMACPHGEPDGEECAECEKEALADEG